VEGTLADVASVFAVCIHCYELVFRWERKNNKSVGFENFFRGFKE